MKKYQQLFIFALGVVSILFLIYKQGGIGRILYQKKGDAPPLAADFYTDVKVEETLFRWSIKNLLILPFEHKKTIESPQFSSVMNPQMKWGLSIHPNGNEEKKYISLFLKSFSKSKVPAKVTLSLWNPKTNNCFKRTTFEHEFHEFLSLGYPKFCSHEDFLKAGDESNRIIIECKIITHTKLESIDSHVLVGQKEESVVLNTMAFDFKNVLEKENFADFTLASSDGVEFKTHKLILSARSSVFSTMFENLNKIKLNKKINPNIGLIVQQNRAEIADMDSKTLKELIEYIYTGECENLNTMAKELLIASDKYDLNDLKVSAAKVLSGTISLENVLDICVTAHLYNAPGLKKIALDFIKLHSNAVVNSTTWNCFSKEYPTLVTELVCI